MLARSVSWLCGFFVACSLSPSHFLTKECVCRKLRELVMCVLCEKWDDNRFWIAKKQQGGDVPREAFWCRKFAQLTVEVVGKLLGRFDRKMDSRKGAELSAELNEQSKADNGVHHSPWLLELSALDESVRPLRISQTSCNTPEKVESPLPSDRGQTSCNYSPGLGKCFDTAESPSPQLWPAQPMCSSPAAESPDHSDLSPYTSFRVRAPPTPQREFEHVSFDDSSDLQSEENVTCPICMEVMYKPVGLGCGHTFCKLCILRSAKISTFNKHFSQLPQSCTCPMCRQDGVFPAAVEMVSLNTLIRTRFTSRWLEQRSAHNKEMERLTKIKDANLRIFRGRTLRAVNLYR